MTHEDENRAWSRVYHEIPDDKIRADDRGWTMFLICAWLLILLAASSIGYTITSIGMELLR